MNESHISKAPQLAAFVIEEIAERVEKSDTRQISDEDLLTLHSVYGATLQRSLDILEKQTCLTVYRTKNNRKLIEIKGKNDNCYRVFYKQNYCPCKAFKHQVIEKKLQLTCKHVLAASLAYMTNKIVFHEVNNEQYLMLLMSMFDIEEV